MNIGEFYKLIVDEGIKQDPRSRPEILKFLNTVKDEYSKLPPAEKEAFDKEKLSNPYGDTRILFGLPKTNIKTIMVGIDIETPELLLADRLRSKGERIDLVAGHHPIGFARMNLHKVMGVLRDILKGMGVSGKNIDKMVDERIEEVFRKSVAGNHPRTTDAARLLNIPLLCMHTVADNFAYQYFNNLLKKKKPSRVCDILDLIYKVPEYRIAMKNGQGPKVILGKNSNKCGKVLIEMTGGTEGPKDIYNQLAKGKVTTLICMHLSEDHFKKAKKHNFNIIIAGHISSDTLGINLLLDKVEKRQKLNVISCSGFTRIRRNENSQL
ncbi:MAG: NGG1p interacting factor NIF3 [Candidatus Omnitrophota bacterium]